MGGLRERAQLIAECDIVLLPKPQHADVAAMRQGQVLWGWPHCVQDAALTQLGIDRRLTIIAWEAMNHYTSDGVFSLHVFHKNKRASRGTARVMHALQLRGVTGHFGPRLAAAVISFGATARGAVAALLALGVSDVTVLTHRSVPAVAAPMPPSRLVHYDRDDATPRPVLAHPERGSLAELLGRHDIVVNCVLQDTDSPLMFVANDDLDLFERGALIIDVVRRGHGVRVGASDVIRRPDVVVGNGIHYYAVDHTPSYLWDSATWEISEALIPHLRAVMSGPAGWEGSETIRRAVEIQDGVVLNPRILSFQNRQAEYPHRVAAATLREAL